MTTCEPTRVGFLIGSGVSMAGGLPGVEKIDECLKDRSSIVLHTDEVFRLAESAPPTSAGVEERLGQIHDFASALRSRITEYLTNLNSSLNLPEREANYEDVANLAQQIADALSGEYENAGLVPLLDQLADDFGSDSVAYLTRSVSQMTRDVVAEILHSHPIPEDFQAVEAIFEGLEDLGQVDVFNLNHDLLMETAMEARDLRASDGFEDRCGDLAFWANDFSQPVRHMKLHGSIDWERRTRPSRPYAQVFAARNLAGQPHPKDADGNLHSPTHDDHPLILTGTFDKGLSYHSDIFGELHGWFTSSLRNLARIVVLGYGFRDKALNSHLIGWLYGNPHRKMIVVHPDPTSLFSNARPAIFRSKQRWEMYGQIALVEHRVSRDLTWDMVRAELGVKS